MCNVSENNWSDGCASGETCIEFENATPQQKILLEQKYQTHLVNKIVARDIKASQKLLSQNNHQSIACLTFDLQKVLDVPSGENGLFYYTLKLAVCNLRITDLVDKDGFCYTWDQTTAKRGANETGSCIYFRAKESLKDHQCITLFSDNCPGQNKNRCIY